ncbi:variable surface protein [Plasmodium gonderi]|uniref:Variable surface protein n=1 Tax=Plasmodium gonderi TaxID=77519 RepID=A0A1Y1JPW3_PLAGO|nr:variable surface protein [Plasmodium gonderi]GAW84666.1 variable surface protein [Plasmodium gonderi]
MIFYNWLIMNNYLGDEELKNLHSKLKYAEFDKKYVNCEGHSIPIDAKSFINKYKWYENDSNKILKAFCYAYRTNMKTDINEDDCDYMFFWLGDIVYRNLIQKDLFSNVMDGLNFFLKSYEGFGICNYYKYDNYYNTHHIFMGIKRLFDFSKDYDILEKYFQTPNRSCNGSFNLYLDQGVIKYRECKNSCNNPSRRDTTCNAFNKYFNDRNKNDLREWTCNSVGNGSSLAEVQQYYEEVVQSPPYGEVKRIENPPSVDHGAPEAYESRIEVPGLQESGIEPPEGEAHRDIQIETSSRTTYQNEDHSVRSILFKEHSIHIPSNDSTLRFIGPKVNAFTDNIDDTLDSSSSQGMIIAPLVIGITVFFIILCKYWLENAFLGKSKRKHNIIMNRNIAENYTMREDIHSARRFNVTYSNI